MAAEQVQHKFFTTQLILWTVICLAVALGPIALGKSTELLRPLVWLAVVLGYRWFEQRVFTPREIHGKRRSEWLFYSIWTSLAGSIVLPPLEFAFFPRPLSVPWMVLGVFLALVGTWLRYQSVKTIGKHFSTHIEVRPGHELVDTGIMSVIRHPGYSGVMTFTLGCALILQSFWSLLFICLVFWTTQFIRIVHEEEELGENLPGYRDYMKRTKRLIPFVF
jgi:protein-S-isoprenylcysteine O-methyltransferase Ste14